MPYKKFCPMFALKYLGSFTFKSYGMQAHKEKKKQFPKTLGKLVTERS